MISIDMEMPESCGKCPFHTVESFFDNCCIIGSLGFEEGIRNKRYSKCPLMPGIKKTETVSGAKMQEDEE